MTTLTSDPVQLAMLETTLHTFETRVQWHAHRWSSPTGVLWNLVKAAMALYKGATV